MEGGSESKPSTSFSTFRDSSKFIMLFCRICKLHRSMSRLKEHHLRTHCDEINCDHIVTIFQCSACTYCHICCNCIKDFAHDNPTASNTSSRMNQEIHSEIARVLSILGLDSNYANATSPTLVPSSPSSSKQKPINKFNKPSPRKMDPSIVEKIQSLEIGHSSETNDDKTKNVMPKPKNNSDSKAKVVQTPKQFTSSKLLRLSGCTVGYNPEEGTFCCVACRIINSILAIAEHCFHNHYESFLFYCATCMDLDNLDLCGHGNYQDILKTIAKTLCTLKRNEDKKYQKSTSKTETHDLTCLICHREFSSMTAINLHSRQAHKDMKTIKYHKSIPYNNVVEMVKLSIQNRKSELAANLLQKLNNSVNDSNSIVSKPTVPSLIQLTLHNETESQKVEPNSKNERVLGSVVLSKPTAPSLSQSTLHDATESQKVKPNSKNKRGLSSVYEDQDVKNISSSNKPPTTEHNQETATILHSIIQSTNDELIIIDEADMNRIIEDIFKNVYNLPEVAEFIQVVDEFISAEAPITQEKIEDFVNFLNSRTVMPHQNLENASIETPATKDQSEQ